LHQTATTSEPTGSVPNPKGSKARIVFKRRRREMEIKTLVAKVRELEIAFQKRGALEIERDALWLENKTLATDLEKAIEALRFYRDGKEGKSWPAQIMVDGGRLARSILKELGYGEEKKNVCLPCETGIPRHHGFHTCKEEKCRR
jgi:hypothetical protein